MNALKPLADTDYAELSRLVTEAAWRVDLGRADTLHELFVDEGELILPPLSVRGRQAIYEWGRRLVDAHTYRCIRHVCSNMRFTALDADTAEGSTILTVFMVAGSGSATTLPWSVGEDHDQFVRTEHGWRILTRRWVELFTRQEALMNGATRPTPTYYEEPL